MSAALVVTQETKARTHPCAQRCRGGKSDSWKSLFLTVDPETETELMLGGSRIDAEFLHWKRQAAEGVETLESGLETADKAEWEAMDFGLETADKAGEI